MKKFIAGFLVTLLVCTGVFGQVGSTRSGLFGTHTSPHPIAVAFEMNATDDANLVFGVSPLVATVNDVSGNGRNLTQANVNNQASRFVASINGVNTLGFSVATGTNFYTMTNGLTWSKNVPGFFACDVFKTSTFAAVNNILSVFANNGTSLLLDIRTNANTGELSTVTRRITSDAQISTNSGLRFILNVQQAWCVGVDYTTGNISFYIDNTNSSKAAVWASGYGFTENLNAGAAPIIGRNGSLTARSEMARLKVGTGVLTEADAAASRAALITQFATPFTTVAFNSPAGLGANRVYQQDGSGLAMVAPFTGTIISGGDSAIQMKFINSVTSATVIDWATVTTSSGGVWTTPSVQLPAGSVIAKARKAGEGEYDAATAGDIIGVGDLDLAMGQSNIRKWWGDDCRQLPFANASVTVALPGAGSTLNGRRFGGYGWFDPTQTTASTQNSYATFEPQFNSYGTTPTNQGVGGNGTAAITALYWTRRAVPYGQIGYAIGGTPISNWLLPDGRNILNMLDSITLVGAPGWTFKRVVYTGGEFEANSGTSEAVVKADMLAVMAQTRAQRGDPNLPFYISILGGINSATSDAVAAGVRKAQMDIIADPTNKAFYAWSLLDQPLLDVQHPLCSAYGTFSAPRYEQTLAFNDNLSVESGVGPMLTSIVAAAGNNYIDIMPTFVSGTALQDSSDNINGCGLSQFGGLVSGVSAGSWAANVLTFTTASSTNVEVGQSFTVSGVTPAAYNGTYVATTGTTGTTLKAALLSDPGTYVTGGVAAPTNTPVSVAGSPRNGTAACIISGQKVRLTFDGAALVSGDTVSTCHQCTKVPPITNVVRDNTSLKVVAQPAIPLTGAVP